MPETLYPTRMEWPGNKLHRLPHSENAPGVIMPPKTPLLAPQVADSQKRGKSAEAQQMGVARNCHMSDTLFLYVWDGMETSYTGGHNLKTRQAR